MPPRRRSRRLIKGGRAQNGCPRSPVDEQGHVPRRSSRSRLGGGPSDPVSPTLIHRMTYAAGASGIDWAEAGAEPAAAEARDPTDPTAGALTCWQSGERWDPDGACLGRSGLPGRQCKDMIAQARARRFSAPPAADLRYPPRARAALSATEPVAFEHVLAAAQQNASWALTRLYESLAPAVVGYMRSQGIREAEDLTSDVFVVVLSRTRSFSGTEGQFRKWVFTIAHHRIVDERRRSGRAPQLEPIDGADLTGRQAGGGAEEEALGRLGTERIRLQLAALTADQRDVLVLRVIAGMSVDEVASMLDKRPEAVKALQRRALAALRRQGTTTKGGQG